MVVAKNCLKLHDIALLYQRPQDRSFLALELGRHQKCRSRVGLVSRTPCLWRENKLRWRDSATRPPHSSGRRCSSNSAILRMRPGNGLRRNGRALYAFKAICLSLSILRHDTYFWKTGSRTLYDKQHRNRLDLCSS